MIFSIVATSEGLQSRIRHPKASRLAVGYPSDSQCASFSMGEDPHATKVVLLRDAECDTTFFVVGVSRVGGEGCLKPLVLRFGSLAPHRLYRLPKVQL